MHNTLIYSYSTTEYAFKMVLMNHCQNIDPPYKKCPGTLSTTRLLEPYKCHRKPCGANEYAFKRF